MQEADEVALEEEDCNEDNFHAVDERYARDTYPRLDQVCDGPHVIKEVIIDQFQPEQSYMGPKEADYKADEVFRIGILDLCILENYYRRSKSRYSCMKLDQRKNLEAEERRNFCMKAQEIIRTCRSFEEESFIMDILGDCILHFQEKQKRRNIKVKRNRARKRKKERRIKQIEKVRIG